MRVSSSLEAFSLSCAFVFLLLLLTVFFLQALQKFQLGFFFFFWGNSVSLYLLGPEFANYTYTRLFLVSYSFFVFCCWSRDVCMCRHCSKGPQVCLTLRCGLWWGQLGTDERKKNQGGQVSSNSCPSLFTYNEKGEGMEGVHLK